MRRKQAVIIAIAATAVFCPRSESDPPVGGESTNSGAGSSDVILRGPLGSSSSVQAADTSARTPSKNADYSTTEPMGREVQPADTGKHKKSLGARADKTAKKSAGLTEKAAKTSVGLPFKAAKEMMKAITP